MKAKQAPASKSNASSVKPQRESFFRFLLAKPQRKELIFMGAGMLLVHIILYNLYPVPCWYYDTNNYLQSAEAGTFSGYRPFGYSWFLIKIRNFSGTMYAVYFFQFWVNAVASVLFVEAVKFIFKPKTNWLYYAFCVFALGSPSVLYMTDYIMSDSLFISFTVLWVTSCMIILYNRSIPAMVLHAVSLLALLHIRYAGMFYPAFSIAVFFIAYRGRWLLASAFSLVPLLICWQLISYNKTQMKKLVNMNLFSGFSGWVLANNAVHMVPWIDLKPEDIKDPVIREIHTYALQLPDSVYIRNGITSWYMWNKDYPFKHYLMKTIQQNQTYYLREWVRTSLDFDKYAKFLIKKYPGQFFLHYLWPNTKEAIYPGITFTDEFNAYVIIPSDNKWFEERPEEYVQPEHPLYHTYIAPILSEIVLFQWLAFFAALVAGLIFRKRMVFTFIQRMAFWFFLLFIAAYTGFNILAAPFMVRYLLPIHVMQVAVIFLVVAGIFARPSDKAVATGK